MPDLDGGHYFLTAIVPVCNDGIVEHEGMRSSPIHMVREALETLPTALQSKAAESVGIQSPFARSLRTHFARFLVLDQPFYNGRDHADAVISTLKSTDLLAAEPVDRLACPYLMVMIDFDPVDPDGKNEPRAYLEELWTLMPEELSAIFSYCYGFSKVTDPASFADFLLPCQLETTMPFNDYWVGAPPLPSLSKASLLLAPVAGLLLPWIGFDRWAWGWWPGWVALGLGLVFAAIGVLVDYRRILAAGAKSFPTSDAPLRKVLKSLYLQQAFTAFAIERQGQDPASQGPAFRDFLERHRPNDLTGPTQPPGVIRYGFAKAAS